MAGSMAGYDRNVNKVEAAGRGWNTDSAYAGKRQGRQYGNL